MKKIFKIIFVVLLTITISGCNSRDDVEHLSQKELIKYVDNNITEKIEFIEANTNDSNNYIYTFKMVDRNINFEIKDSIINHGINMDGTQFYDDYHRSIVFNDYVISIINNLEQQRLQLLEKYSFREEYFDTIGSHIIYVENNDSLSDLSRYIVELDNLYQFNIKNIDEIELWIVDLKDVISFSDKCSIEGITYSTNKRARLKYKKVYKELEKQYKQECLNK